MANDLILRPSARPYLTSTSTTDGTIRFQTAAGVAIFTIGPTGAITTAGALTQVGALAVTGAITATTSIAATTTVTAGTGLTVTTGNALISAGNLTLTLGNAVLTAGNLTVSSGLVAITSPATAAGADTLTITPGAHTAQLAEKSDVIVAAHTNTITGAITTQRFNRFMIPTISAATALTVTNAATLYVEGQPAVAGAGPAAITNPYALWVDAGNSRFDGDSLHLASTAIPATAGAVAAGVPLSMYTTGITVEVTSNAPSHTRPKGSLCIATDGSSSTTRLFINTNGGTGWTSITTAT